LIIDLYLINNQDLIPIIAVLDQLSGTGGLGKN